MDVICLKSRRLSFFKIIRYSFNSHFPTFSLVSFQAFLVYSLQFSLIENQKRNRVVLSRPAVLASLGTCSECKRSGPTPDPLRGRVQLSVFSQDTQVLWCMPMLENHYINPSSPSRGLIRQDSSCSSVKLPLFPRLHCILGFSIPNTGHNHYFVGKYFCNLFIFCLCPF